MLLGRISKIRRKVSLQIDSLAGYTEPLWKCKGGQLHICCKGVVPKKPPRLVTYFMRYARGTDRTGKAVQEFSSIYNGSSPLFRCSHDGSLLISTFYSKRQRSSWQICYLHLVEPCPHRVLGIGVAYTYSAVGADEFLSAPGRPAHVFIIKRKPRLGLTTRNVFCNL